MEKCLENQIFHLLKQNGLIDIKQFIFLIFNLHFIYSPNNAFAQITIVSGTPFVYCFNQTEIPIDTNQELAEALFGSLGQQTGGEDDVSSIKSSGAISAEEIQRILTQITEPLKLDKGGFFYY
jgi:hypothetical protein